MAITHNVKLAVQPKQAGSYQLYSLHAVNQVVVSGWLEYSRTSLIRTLWDQGVPMSLKLSVILKSLTTISLGIV